MMMYSKLTTYICLVLLVFLAGALFAQGDGSIVAWGSNNHGQCTVPAPNTGFVEVAGGYKYSLGLHSYSLSVGDADDPVHEILSISSIYPNPFSSNASVTLQSPGLENVRLEVFNTAGRLVSSREMGAMAEGQHIVSWNVCDESGHTPGSGIYIIHIVSGSGEFASARVVLLR